MNFKVKVLVIVMVCFQTFMNAQGNFKILPTIGVSTPALDNGTGVQLGLNPSYSVTDYFAFEGQVSYNRTKVTGTFISGKTGSDNSLNVLTGGRLYILPSKYNVRPYINLLAGGMVHSKKRDNSAESTSEIRVDVGISTGIFVEINKFVVGFSLETPDNMVLKAGFVF